MPQPIRKKCHAEISGFIHRPAHAKVLGDIVGISGRLESALGWLLAFLSGGGATLAMSMFHAVASADAQKAMLQAAAKHRLTGVELEAFDALMEDYRPRYRERNRLIHNLWGHSNDHPDKALWWRSTDLGSAVSRIAAATTAQDWAQTTAEEWDISLRAMAYTVQDLQDVANRLWEYTLRVGTFTQGLIAAHPAIAALANAAPNRPPNEDQPQANPPQSPQTGQG